MMPDRPTTQKRHVAHSFLSGNVGPGLGIGGPGQRSEPPSTPAQQQRKTPVNEIERLVEEAHERGDGLSFVIKRSKDKRS